MLLLEDKIHGILKKQNRGKEWIYHLKQLKVDLIIG